MTISHVKTTQTKGNTEEEKIGREGEELRSLIDWMPVIICCERFELKFEFLKIDFEVKYLGNQPLYLQNKTKIVNVF